MQIAILVDDNGTGLFRVGGRAIHRGAARARRVLDHHRRRPAAQADAVHPQQRVAARGSRQLIAGPDRRTAGSCSSGIYESALDFERRKVERPVILALTVGGEEHTPLPPHHVLDQLRKSGAALHVVSVARLDAAVQRLRPRARGPAEREHGLNQVLGDGPKRSGGRREEVPAIAGAQTGLHQLAETLKRQYVVEYALPAGVKPSDRFSVSSKRRDVTLRAPTHIPDK